MRSPRTTTMAGRIGAPPEPSTSCAARSTVTRGPASWATVAAAQARSKLIAILDTLSGPPVVAQRERPRLPFAEAAHQELVELLEPAGGGHLPEQPFLHLE